MPILKFPPVENADEMGLLAVGGDLSIESLLLAYRAGIFPWPVEDEPLMWFAPPQRAILDFEDFKIPRRFKRELKKLPFDFKVNKNFLAVIENCAKSNNRKNQEGTWITDEIILAYHRLYAAGYAYSFEAYEDDELVGGLYGVLIGQMFAGESMFYHRNEASKFALVHTVDYLKESGLTWMDIQQSSALLLSFGAKEIQRDQFMNKLQKTLGKLYVGK